MLKKILIVLLLLSIFSINSVLGQVASREEEDLYNFGMSLYSDGMYKLAAEQLDKFERNYPESKKLPEVRFYKAEALFKALGRALDIATRIDERISGELPSTKDFKAESISES